MLFLIQIVCFRHCFGEVHAFLFFDEWYRPSTNPKPAAAASTAQFQTQIDLIHSETEPNRVAEKPDRRSDPKFVSLSPLLFFFLKGYLSELLGFWRGWGGELAHGEFFLGHNKKTKISCFVFRKTFFVSVELEYVATFGKDAMYVVHTAPSKKVLVQNERYGAWINEVARGWMWNGRKGKRRRRHPTVIAPSFHIQSASRKGIRQETKMLPHIPVFSQFVCRISFSSSEWRRTFPPYIFRTC